MRKRVKCIHKKEPLVVPTKNMNNSFVRRFFFNSEGFFCENLLTSP